MIGEEDHVICTSLHLQSSFRWRRDRKRWRSLYEVKNYSFHAKCASVSEEILLRWMIWTEWRIGKKKVYTRGWRWIGPLGPCHWRNLAICRLNVETAVFSLYHDLCNWNYLDILVVDDTGWVGSLGNYVLDKVLKYAEMKWNVSRNRPEILWAFWEKYQVLICVMSPKPPRNNVWFRRR